MCGTEWEIRPVCITLFQSLFYLFFPNEQKFHHTYTKAVGKVSSHVFRKTKAFMDVIFWTVLIF